MNPKFPIEAFKFLRLTKLEQLKLIRNGRFHLRAVYTLSGRKINFNCIKNMTYQEAINTYNKVYSINDNNTNNEYDESELDSLSLNKIFKYLIELNIRAEKEIITELDLSEKNIGETQNQTDLVSSKNDIEEYFKPVRVLGC